MTANSGVRCGVDINISHRILPKEQCCSVLLVCTSLIIGSLGAEFFGRRCYISIFVIHDGVPVSLSKGTHALQSLMMDEE